MKSTDHKKDRLCYILEELFNYLITVLVSGSYLAKITAVLGFSDSLTAILNSFVTLGCSTQILSGLIFRGGRIKRRITTIFSINQLLFMLLYLVPIVRLSKGVRTILFVVLLLCGHLMLNLALAPRTNWFMSFVDNGKRGVFTAKKEAFSLLVGFVFQMAMGAMIDVFEAQGNLRAAFVVCAIVILGISAGHTLSLILTQDKQLPESSQPVLKEIQCILTDKKVRPILWLTVLWAVACNVSTPFYGTYTIKELGFSMSFLAVLSLVSALARILASIFLGKYADKHSFAKMLRLCYGLAAVGYVAAAFTVPENGKMMYTVYLVAYSMALGGVNSARINLIFDYVAPEKRTMTLAAQQAFYGTTGFLASVIVTPLLQATQNAGNHFLGVTAYAQQVLSVLAFVCTAFVLVYLELTVIKLRPESKTQ